ncbi:MAG: aminoacyl-tRNA hydrolase [Candidatus Wallbacteria bacterium]|nr:aminoacyl-tRNA hydrolase [Candidatus Wallbacteria bacterium]
MIVAGLGNPGPRYAMNRHNVGFLFLDHLVEKLGAGEPFRFKSSFDAEVAEVRLEGERHWLVKPQAYMNLSGGPVSRVASYYKVKPSDVVAVYDDVALPFGSIRVRPGGSAGGHKGMISIIEQLGTDEFPRIRIGIAQTVERKKSLAGYVLDDFDAAERQGLPAVLDQATEALGMVAAQDMAKAMAKFNKRVAARADDAPQDADQPQR